MHALLTTAVALAALLSTAGCGESVEEWLATRRPIAEAQLARVAKVRALAPSVPSSDWGDMRDPGPMAICDLVIAPYREAGCDAWVIDQAQLASPRTFVEPLVSFGHADWLVTTTSVLETGRYAPTPAYPQGGEVDRLTRPILYAFAWLEQIQYVFVVRTAELVPPKLAADQKSYAGGTYRGEAILFSLRPEPKALGSVPFVHVMAGDLKLRMRGGRLHQQQIDKAFGEGVRQALAEALVTRLKQLERPSTPSAQEPAPVESE